MYDPVSFDDISTDSRPLGFIPNLTGHFRRSENLSK